MAMRVSATFLAAAALTTLSGCGTLLNMSHTPYGGVWNDAQLVAVGAKTVREGDPFGLVYSAGWLADVPFSLVADTLMLPYAPDVYLERFLPGPPTLPYAKGGPLYQEPEAVGEGVPLPEP